MAVTANGVDSRLSAEAVTDLPGPPWEQLRLNFPLQSIDSVSGHSTNRPYFYVIVPLLGPEHAEWKETWVQFLFDADGKLTLRSIERRIKHPNYMECLSREWPIGKGLTPDLLFEQHPQK